jgi:hypothetical protein
MNLKDKIIKKVTDKARQTGQSILKRSGIKNEFTQSSLSKICKVYISTINLVPTYIPTARTKIINALQDDIHTLIKQNKTKEEIISFYFTVEEFKKLWHIIGLVQLDFENIIDYQFNQKEKL